MSDSDNAECSKATEAYDLVRLSRFNLLSIALLHCIFHLVMLQVLFFSVGVDSLHHKYWRKIVLSRCAGHYLMYKQLLWINLENTRILK